MQTKRSAEDTFGTLRAQPVHETPKKTKLSTLTRLIRDLSIKCSSTLHETLHLTDKDRMMGDEDLIEHARQFESLETFLVADGRCLTDYSLTRILTPSHQFLRTFDIATCLHVTDRTLFALKRSAPFLEELSLKYCPHVTDTGIQAVAKQCKLFTKLKLDCCPKITGRALLTVARCCQNLQEITLAGNTRVNFLNFLVLIKRCSRLHIIGLVGCTQVNNDWLSAITTTLPEIEYLNVRHTSITQDGLSNFRTNNPNCYVDALISRSQLT